MKNLKEKVPVFLLGLMFGLIIAGGFFILKLDEYFKELNDRDEVAVSYNTEKAAETQKGSADITQSKKSKSKKENSSNAEEASSSKDLTVNDITDTTANVTRTDSLSGIASDDIVVKKDELLSTISLEVFNLNPVASRSGKDSVLQKMSGIKDDRITGKQMFNIEYWTSPLNYKGYKMSKYKIVLYGLTAADAVKIYKLDETIYLKSNTGVFRLEPVSDFRSYDRVTDDVILSKLK